MDWTFLEFGKLAPATWMYLSALLSIAIFFRFRRVVSLRNWDILTLYLFVPGLLATNLVDDQIAQRAPETVIAEASGPVAANQVKPADSLQSFKSFGYLWLFGVTAYFFVRSVVDVLLTRTRRLDPNLNQAGITFLTVCLFGYLIIIIASRQPEPVSQTGARVALSLLSGNTKMPQYKGADPATVLFMLPPAAVQKGLANTGMKSADGDRPADEQNIVRSALIICHLLLLTGLVLIGWRHFQGIESGLAMALLYLLIPITFLHAIKLDHLIPTTLVVWALFAHQVPIVAGILLALAAVSFFPLLLLPLWASFYASRGLYRFAGAFIATTLFLWLIAYFVPPLLSFLEMWSSSLSSKVLIAADTADKTIGIWSPGTQIYRLPLVIVFGIALVTFLFVPKQKTFSDLISLSTALLLLAQFWYADRGGTHVQWYLPLLIMMVFRPNSTTGRPSSPVLSPSP